MSKYWEKRAAQKMWEYMEDAEKTAEQITELYVRASRYLSYEAQEIFEKYMTKHNLSEAEARRLLNDLQDKTSYDELLTKYKSSSLDPDKAEVLTKLEAPAYRARIIRLEQLQATIDLVMQNLYQEEKKVNTEHYIDLATDAYHRGIYDIQKRTGLAFSFSAVSPKVIDQIIDSNWSGENYSKRIWNRVDDLAKTLKEELMINLVTGRTNREAAEVIQQEFVTTAFNARRLVRTESCYVAGEVEAVSYEECGIEKYIFIATLDLVTSKHCREKDNKRFKLSEKKVGENYPPLHPWCRSTTIADIPDEILAKMERKARDPVTGGTMKVPADMDYDQWYEKYVANNPDAQAAEKMIKNYNSDKKQYEKYKEIIPDKVPETLEDFQKMKYTDSKRWGEIKQAFKESIGQYHKSFREYGDHTYDITGSAKQSHPEELEAIKRTLDEKGIGIEITKRTLAYEPNLTAGNPGKIKITDEASIGAWRHEFQHVLDDEKSGWLGFRNMMNPDTFWRMEYNGYVKELALARQYKRYDIGKKVLQEMRDRKNEIYGRD